MANMNFESSSSENDLTRIDWFRRILSASVGCFAVIIAGDPEAFNSKK